MENHSAPCAQDEAKRVEQEVRRVCRASKNIRTEMTELAWETRQIVQECASGLMDASGNDRRYLTVCRMLERLEDQKRALDECLSRGFCLDESFMQAMFGCLAWQGEWMSRGSDVAELETLCNQIERASSRLQEEKGRCVEHREKFGVLARETIPKFLLEIQRHADADGRGRAMRAQSVCTLCGELCNHIASKIGT